MAAHLLAVRPGAVAEPSRILDSLNTSVLLVDRNCGLLHLNVAAETLFGVSRNQVCGRHFQELLVDASGLLTVVDRVLQSNRPFSRRELALQPIGADSELVVDCSVTPFDEASASGISGGILIEITDATQHQRI